ncbi:MAG: Calx-beta domain-containing protein [Planctomycetota bacterium]
MGREVRSLICAVLVMGLVNSAGAGLVIMQCDVGDCGPLQSGWTGLGGCGIHANVAGTGIDVTLATGNPGACECRNPGGTGTLADVEADLLFANDQQSSPGGDFIITFSNLVPGASYRLLSYHNRSNEGDTTIPGVTITAATTVSVPASILQSHAIMDNPAECIFIAGAGDASIRFEAPAGGCAGCQVFLNGFVLELNAPTLTFESDASGGIETISPALIPVNLINPEPGETYTVQYNVIAGTATPGDDYSLTPGTLIFSPGDSTEYINIDIVNDGEPEEDETIILELSGATGLDVVLGIDQHTYTISDTRPKVSFLSASSSGLEGTTPVLVPVKLSIASDETVTVNYAATSGSATNGSDYVLAPGTLQFDPLDTTEYISIDIVSDSIKEADETIILSLSDPCNATLGMVTQHTRLILDDEEGTVWDNKIWYYSSYSGGPFVNPEGQLEWDPEKPEQFITRLPTQRLSVVGDVAEVVYWLMTDGDHSCPDCFSCALYCLDDDITCIAGTSDFRFGLFEADGQYITSDGMGTSNSIFEGYKGYNWRFGPNMIAGPTRWVDCTNEVHKTGNFAKKPVGSSSLMTNNEGLEDYIPGLEQPPGEWSLLTLRLARTGSSDIEMLITYNHRTYTWADGSSSGQPDKIDVFGVHMRNGRPYDRLVLDRLCVPPPGDLDGDEDEDENDLGIFCDYWLNRCRPSEGWCAGADINQDAKVTLIDFAWFAARWRDRCE